MDYFTVFRIDAAGNPQLLGHAVFIEDAIRLLDGWANGYIIDPFGNETHTK